MKESAAPQYRKQNKMPLLRQEEAFTILLLSFRNTLQELAPIQIFAGNPHQFERLPGFIGPVPPPLWIRVIYELLINIIYRA
jgi:hypothetical protein